MREKQLRNNIVYQILYRVLTVITPLITAPYLSRVLGSSSLGVFSATYAYANYFLLFAMLGIELYGTREIAQVSDSTIASSKKFFQIYSIQIIAFLFAVIIYYLSLPLVFGEERMEICYLQGIWIIATGFDVNWFLFGKQMFRATVIRNIIMKILSIVVMFVFVHNSSDLSVYVLIMALSTLLSQLLMWPVLLSNVKIVNISFNEVVPHIKPIMILFIPILALSVFHIMDKTMVDLLSDEKNGGFYYNVDRLVNIPLNVITGVSLVFLPRFSQMFLKGEKNNAIALLNKSIELIVMMSCALAFGIGAIANEFVPFFFGEQFMPCIQLLYAFIPIIIIKALSDFMRQQFIIPAHKDNIYVIAVVVGALVNFVANIYLIKRYGALGAVFGTFIAEGIVLLIENYGCRRDVKFLNMLINNTWYFGGGIFMFMLLRALASCLYVNLSLKVIILILMGGGFYFIWCAFYWHFNKHSIFHVITNNIRFL